MPRQDVHVLLPLPLKSHVTGIAWPAMPNQAGSAMLAALLKSEWLSRPQLWELQRTQLLELLRHAVATVPFHRKRLMKLQESLGEIFLPEDLQRLPLMSRKDLQDHFDSLLSGNVPGSHGHTSNGVTSGSTGDPAHSH